MLYPYVVLTDNNDSAFAAIYNRFFQAAAGPSRFLALISLVCI